MFRSATKLSVKLILVINICFSGVLSKISEKQENSPDPENSKSQPPPFNPSLRRHYVLDSRATKRLALAEEHLLDLTYDILSNASSESRDLNPCYFYLRKYRRELRYDLRYVYDTRGIRRADITTENPNLTFRMIRRIVEILLNQTINACKTSDPSIEAAIEDIFTSVDLTLPTQQDLDDALVGLIRIHYVYQLNATTEIRLGIFNDIDTKARLNFEDCLALANKAIELGTEALAYQWITSAFIVQDEIPGVHLEEGKALRSAWLKLKKLVEVKTLDDLHNLLHNRTQDKFSYFDYPEMYATCRGELTQPIEFQSKLRCFYQFDWDPYFYINPVKTEALSGDPLIFQFYDFVSDQTIDYMKRTVRNKMYISEHSRGENKFVSAQYRTSVTGWLADRNGKEDFPEMVKLTRRIEKLTGLELYKKMASYLTQIIIYGAPGGHYDFHFDSLQNSGVNIEKEGDRLATMLTFLSDVKMGGYTVFPFAGVFAKPVKGSAIVWYNTKLNGNMDARLRHGGCPVVLGTKIVATRMVFQYENMFKEPCALNPEE